MKHEELTSRIIGICIKVQSILGPGLLEAVYEEAMCYELSRTGIYFLRQQGINVHYEDVQLGIGFRADIIVENTIVIELKSVQAVAPVHAKTVITYLKFTGIEVGLLINFNVALLKDGITRLIRDNKPT
jgi:GxxExxY protein